MDTTTAYSWVPYYEKLADALLPYADRRQELIQKLWASFQKHGCHLPKWNETHTQPADIDPFTVFSVFCIYGMRPANRLKCLHAVAEVLGVQTDPPTDFNGISCMHPQRANFYSWDAPTSDCDNLWTIFKMGLQYADGQQTADEFIRAYDVVHEQKGIQWNITIGLFWIRPNFYINLDSTSRDFIANDAFYEEIKSQIWERSKRGVEQAIPLTGKGYATFCNDCRALLKRAQSQYHSFPELSSAAWKYSQESKPPKPKKDITSPSGPDVIAAEDSPKEENEQYTKEDFLHDVFMTEEKYAQTVAALEYKYNIILQGPPGVGKSYAAKRLAYSLMGERDDERICMIQFHHSYSYEDFMQGYRPDKDGKFTLRNGIFYNFCKKAESSDKEYYLIIDEINRGDLNKIFGETFLLMEKDKRGTDSVQLAYSPELGSFTIPKNIRIIGMMNTADRSIALIDHALRRRFAFIELEPAYGMPAFQSFVQNAPSAEKLLKLLVVIADLNKKIAEDSSLGRGYRIGHSYFCPSNPAELTNERLNTIVEFELIPLLEEYWFDEPDEVTDWSLKLRNALK